MHRVPPNDARRAFFGGCPCFVRVSQVSMRWAALGMLTVAVNIGLLQGQQLSTTLKGVIADSATGQPISGAWINVVGVDIEDRTGASGAFRLNGIGLGTHIFMVRSLGFAPRGFRLTITWSNIGEVDLGTIRLAANATRLEDLNVVARFPSLLTGFNRRRERGFGHFITRAEIERRRPLRSTDLLRRVPGVAVQCRGGECRTTISRMTRPGRESLRLGGPSPFVGSRDALSSVANLGVPAGLSNDALIGSLPGSLLESCPIQYYVDGVPYPADQGIDDIPPDEIVGIEIYKGPAYTPAIFAMHGGSCGVIAVWTRGRD